MPYYPQTPGIYPYTTATSTGATVAYVSVTNTTLLAANANRRGGMIYNNTTVNLQIRLSANALTQPTVLLVPGAYYEIPFGWTGIVDGYCFPAGSGNVWVTELTA